MRREEVGRQEPRAHALAGSVAELEREHRRRAAASRAPRRMPRRSVGSTSSPLRPCSICSAMPPRRDPTTGRSFHIASVTVRPKPSARLFCTTTSARRWSAFTTTAFSTRSTTGRLARWVRARSACWERDARRRGPRRAPRRPRGRRRRPRPAGPASTRCAPRSWGTPCGEPLEHADRILQPVPSRDLHDERGGRRHRGLLDHLGRGDAHADRRRHRQRHGRVARRAPRSLLPRPAPPRPTGCVDRDVLGRAGVDARRDDRDTTAGSRPSHTYAGRVNTGRARPARRRAGTVQAVARDVVGDVDADVADPDHVRTLAPRAAARARRSAGRAPRRRRRAARGPRPPRASRASVAS